MYIDLLIIFCLKKKTPIGIKNGIIARTENFVPTNSNEVDVKEIYIRILYVTA